MAQLLIHNCANFFFHGSTLLRRHGVDIFFRQPHRVEDLRAHAFFRRHFHEILELLFRIRHGIHHCQHCGIMGGNFFLFCLFCRSVIGIMRGQNSSEGFLLRLVSCRRCRSILLKKKGFVCACQNMVHTHLLTFIGLHFDSTKMIGNFHASKPLEARACAW